MKEQVLVFPATMLNGITFEKGLIKDPSDVEANTRRILTSNYLSFADRETTETDESVKQLIAYNVLWQNGKVFCYKRTKKGQEVRLHDLRSLGVGGHCSKLDGQKPCEEAFWSSMERELQEEVGLTNDYEYFVKALLYDDSNAVGRVHFGVINYVELGDKAELSFKDYALGQGGFEDVKTIKKYKDDFENWSKIIIEGLL